MNRLKSRILVIIFLLVNIQLVSATVQIGDILIYNGDTLRIRNYPLEKHTNLKAIKEMFKIDGYNTGCVRDYIAQWEIIDKELYLTAIYKPYTEQEVIFDWNKAFGATASNKRVKASWYSGDLIVGKGKTLATIDTGYINIHEEDEVLTLENGTITNTKLYDNSSTYQSPYSQNFKLLQRYIYQNIDWDKLPLKDDQAVSMIVSIISGNKQRKVDDVKIIRGDQDIYSQEAIRVIKSLPEWSYYYQRGKEIFDRLTFRITFSKQKQQEYNKQ